MINDDPLIYTTHGNVPLSTLDYKHYWEDGLILNVKPAINNGQMSLAIEKDGQMAFVEEYTDKITGELVKRNVALYRFKGLSLAPDAGQLG
jgi:type II secretory pathway component GspD/PulD (secretin)